MNDISDYIQRELIKTPFNLYNLITKYIESNKNTKVAFVGGYLRDLLISKFHKKPFSKPVDIDLVIEGSSIALAKFIKKNIVNVDLCLIKEFNLYNTVEININDYKIDIASARKEIYPAPGLNPKVTKSTIEEDLKRRDFTINSIAFEVSTRKIYDLYGGISDIKSKKLNLLHSNSISDDPSRLIRCAKYASRLDFNISKNSLKQSQETVRQWPWKSSETHQKIIYPPALSIRTRMELAEICKHDNLNNVILIINKWKIISILNKNIKVDKRFLRGLSWIKKLNGNYILYLLKDAEDLEKGCQRFLINHGEKKILEDYLNIKKILKTNQEKLMHFSPSSWTEFIESRNLNDETIKLLICDGVPYWRNLFKWLFIYKFIKSKKDGETLKKEGWEQGKEMGKEIKRLRYLEIDNLKRN
ncbi:tRNA nucleotidyltransferase [Prochlorococcus marinus str. MU1402]|uniref:CCA tRNA nucleotidyltransferase n=1 Tax=Prochlorococcus marinus TaxID=1219 RepID=UPI001ADBDD94|nr:CCA tRNA nucleotidyltransferase [Prochlorococcus marinus]MBO8231328.1 CCA tRNA nucleotidyltransferase [Prochlorococcus marinus XMU1402]MBW3056092.1 tRNA nucleotidyltransferase [Prochlorococcus marinus str. MU1402]